MTEAAATQSPTKLRFLFATLLTACELSNPERLWDLHKENLTEDILMQVQRKSPDIDFTYTADMFNQALVYIEDKVLEMAGKRLQDLSLPALQRHLGDRLGQEMLCGTTYDVDELNEYVLGNQLLLTTNQRNLFDVTLNLVNETKDGLRFLDAPDGIGKTFVINLILPKIRQQSKVAIAMASSGIATTLLHGGRTAHSTLKVPAESFTF